MDKKIDTYIRMLQEAQARWAQEHEEAMQQKYGPLTRPFFTGTTFHQPEDLMDAEFAKLWDKELSLLPSDVDYVARILKEDH